jgi:predicted PurR-regulated permease PerM
VPSADLARRTVVVVLVALLLLALALLVWSGVYVLLQAFAGVLLAVFLSSLADFWSHRTGLSYRWALAVVGLGLLALVVATGWLLASHLALQFGLLLQELPQSFERIRNYLDQYYWGRLLLEKAPEAASTWAQENPFSRMTGLITGVSHFLITAVVILFVGIFGAAEPALYRACLLHLVPPRHRHRAGEALDAVVFNLRWWLLGQVFMMVVMGLTTALGLKLLGIPFALTLGVIAGILELVPYVGPWISAVPAALVALLQGPGPLAMTLALYLGLHILEGYVLLPLVQRHAVLMPPALTLVLQVLLGDLLGMMGLFVAAPLTASAVVLLKMLYVEDTLGDETVDVPGEPGNEAKPEAGSSSEMPPHG